MAKKQKEFTMNKQGCKGLECTINGVVYASRAKAAKALGVSRGTIFSFLKSGKTELKVEHFGRKKCTINGVVYDSFTSAAKDLGVHLSYISAIVKKGLNVNVKKRERTTRKSNSVVIDGVKYRSFYEAEKKLFGKKTGVLNRRRKRGFDMDNLSGKDLETIGGNSKPCVDTNGKHYKSQSEMSRAIGLSRQTIGQRIRLGVKLYPNRLTSCSHRDGILRYDYYYENVCYHGMSNAKKYLHHGNKWIKENCVSIPVFYENSIKKDGLVDKKTFDIVEYMYRDSAWNEDRIIEECDRRMKKYFAHRKQREVKNEV